MQQIIVLPDYNEYRLDRVLAVMLPDVSRATWAKRIKAGHVRVNGQQITIGKTLVFAEDIVTIEEYAPDVQPIDVPVIYEDDDVIVLNKPTGVLTHAKGALIEEATMADVIRLRTTDGLETNRPGIVHRLDRDTSGVLLAARTNEAKRWLQKQFSDRKVKKTYVALVLGVPREREAKINLPIARNPKKPQLFRVDPNGKSAITDYTVLKTYKEGLSLVELRPLTGRTHQLRVHMHYLGTPIAGDVFYDGKTGKVPRLQLHAQSLEITLPSRQRKVFTAELPKDMQVVLAGLHESE